MQDPVAYEAFFRGPEGNLHQVREHRNIRFAAQYLPPDWLAWKAKMDFQAVSVETGDSAAVFILNIGPAAGSRTGDVMTHGVSGMEDYAARMETMNFRLEESIELRVGDRVLKPVFVHLENTYGLTNDRNLHLVFEGAGLGLPQEQPEDLDLVFDDPVFGTGINHFRFQREALNQLPRLAI